MPLRYDILSGSSSRSCGHLEHLQPKLYEGLHVQRITYLLPTPIALPGLDVCRHQRPKCHLTG